MSGLAAGSPVRDLLADMTAESVAASSLDEPALMLVRIAALVAVDAPVVSYLLNLDAASDVGIDAGQIQGVLAAVAPIVGTARVASAAGKIVEAPAVEIEIAGSADQNRSSVVSDPAPWARPSTPPARPARPRQ